MEHLVGRRLVEDASAAALGVGDPNGSALERNLFTERERMRQWTAVVDVAG